LFWLGIATNGKSIGEVRAFEEQKVQETPNVANAFSILLTYKKNAELKSMSGLFFLLFNFALLPAFCQYNVTCSAYFS